MGRVRVECLRPSAGTAAWHYSLTFLGGIFWKEREGIVYIVYSGPGGCKFYTKWTGGGGVVENCI